MIIGYTAGVYDLFHIGHLNVLRAAKVLCDRLIVAVSTDELVVEMKGKTPIIPFIDRVAIVRAIRHADVVIPQRDRDKFLAWKRLKYNILFVGDDWFETKDWIEYERKLQEVGVQVVYLPYTRGTSSTELSEAVSKRLKL